MSYPRISYHGGHSGDTCDHARDTKFALIESYIAHGFTHVGITEHLPPPNNSLLFPDEIANHHNASFLQNRFDRYFTQTRPRLRQTYGDKLHLAFSFETEWYNSDSASWLETNIEKYSPDYIVASVHHVNDIPIDMSSAKTGEAIRSLAGVDALYQAYYDRQHDLFATLAPYAARIPIVVAHFDLIKLFTSSHDPSEAVWQRIVRNLEFAIANGFVFEVNARAFKKGLHEPYPSAHTLTQIRDMGGEITLGDDSHAVDEVGLHFADVIPVIRPIFDTVTGFEWEEDKLRKVCLSMFG